MYASAASGNAIHSFTGIRYKGVFIKLTTDGGAEKNSKCSFGSRYCSVYRTPTIKQINKALKVARKLAIENSLRAEALKHTR